jgi:hypothetical protein
MTEAVQARTRMNALVPEPFAEKLFRKAPKKFPQLDRSGAEKSFSLLHVQAGSTRLNQSNTSV